MMKRALVFDSLAWDKAGGDIGDNQCFWKSATILHRRPRMDRRVGHINQWLVDVRFDDGRQSCGHFENSVKYFETLDEQFRSKICEKRT